MLQHYFHLAWVMQYPLIPCLTAYLIFELPIIYRRLTRRVYVPIYFAFSPFGYTDELYAKYFNEDSYWMVGGPFRGNERKYARQKIAMLAVLSATLTLILSPFLAATFSYYFLSTREFTFFFWTLAIVKAVLLGKSLYDLRFVWRVTDSIPFVYLVLLYLAYWGITLKVLDRCMQWIETKASGGFGNLLRSVTDLLVFELGSDILLVGLLTFFLSWLMTAAPAAGESEEIDE